MTTTNNMKISEKGINFIKSQEGFKDKEYICPAGKASIGYGHVILPSDNLYSIGKITEDFADKLLRKDLEQVEISINNIVLKPINQNQFDALVSLIMNWGIGNFEKSEGLKKLNQGDYDGASNEFKEVIHCNHKVLAGLVLRRAREQNLWNTTIA